MTTIPGEVIAAIQVRGDDAFVTATGFGRQLKQWRRSRGMSQLALATEAGISQRHVSFLETGRSRPGGHVIQRVADALDLPPRERNALLEAVGLPPEYPELPLDDTQIAPFRAAVAKLLSAQEPYPAMVLNRWWDVVDLNRAASRLFGVPRGIPLNFIEGFFQAPAMRDLVDNFDAVAWAILRRLRREVAHSGADQRASDNLARVERILSGVPAPSNEYPSSELVVCPRLRVGDRLINTLSMVARFGNMREVTLDELQVELMFPQDAEAEAFFRELAATSDDPSESLPGSD